MELTEINKLKAYTRNEFDSDGDTVKLTIKFNQELRDLLKTACVLSLDSVEENLNSGDSDDGNTQYFNFQRHKAKSIFYREFNNSSAKNILYSVDLLENGVLTIPFFSVYRQNDFLENFQRSLKTLIELLIGENIEREISFNLSTPDAE